jgi:hypothetical protein
MSEARIAWRKASRGIYLLGFGVFLLLTTLDYLDWSFWLRALSLWPLILVAAGVRMIFERGVAPWAVLLSPAIVFATLAWVAITTPEIRAGSWGRVFADAPGHPSAWSFEAKAALTEIGMVSGDLAEGRLLEGRLFPEDERAVHVREWGGTARVDLSSFRRGRAVILPPALSRTWDLTLARDLPLSLSIRGGMTEGGVDLGAGRISRLEVAGALHDLRFRLPHPAGKVPISIRGAFNEIEIKLPADTPVSVSSEGPMNFVDGRRSPPRSGGPGYRVRVGGFMNRVRVLDDPSPEGPPSAIEEPGEAEREPAGDRL